MLQASSCTPLENPLEPAALTGDSVPRIITFPIPRFLPYATTSFSSVTPLSLCFFFLFNGHSLTTIYRAKDYHIKNCILYIYSIIYIWFAVNLSEIFIPKSVTFKIKYRFGSLQYYDQLQRVELWKRSTIFTGDGSRRT